MKRERPHSLVLAAVFGRLATSDVFGTRAAQIRTHETTYRKINATYIRPAIWASNAGGFSADESDEQTNIDKTW